MASFIKQSHKGFSKRNLLPVDITLLTCYYCPESENADRSEVGGRYSRREVDFEYLLRLRLHPYQNRR